MSAIARLPGVVSVDQIAHESGTPTPYLAKVLQKLSAAKLIISTRGKKGGHTLARAAETITLLDIINAIEPIERVHQCPLKKPEHAELCPLHASIDLAAKQIEDTLASCNLGSVLVCTNDVSTPCSH